MTHPLDHDAETKGLEDLDNQDRPKNATDSTGVPLVHPPAPYPLDEAMAQAHSHDPEQTQAILDACQGNYIFDSNGKRRLVLPPCYGPEDLLERAKRREDLSARCRALRVASGLPDDCGGIAMPNSPFEGATIVQIGVPEPGQVSREEGGFVIDFIPKGGTTIFRMVFGFTELGIWLEFCKSLAADSKEG